MNLPTDPYFTVSYRLIPKNQAVLAAPQINGAFSFLVEDKTISINIVEKDMNLMALNQDEMKNLIAEAIHEPGHFVNTAVIEEQALPKLIVAEKTKKAPKQTKVTSKKTSGKTQLSYILEPEDGVYYRIQLAAGHKTINIGKYFRKLKLDKEVRKELHDGWNKYSVGSFKVYKEARDYRVYIWDTTPAKDAFVTAYNSGQRITVQEALMITEQQWYQ
jgi:hypothetical protein